LRNILERATILADGGQIEAEHLGFLPGLAPARAATRMQPEVTLHPGPTDDAEGIADVERQMIVAALQSCGGNKSNAAKRLRITRRVLYTKLRKYGLDT
jgi:DNA-binding NtrC family response regulator